MTVPQKIKLFLGIGNPGEEFEHTYHNAGILVVRTLAMRDNAPEFEKVSRKHFAYTKGNTFLFAESLTYMNESGTSAKEICAFFRIRPENLAVLHDESDLPLGEFQCALGKGAAGHKGVLSVAEMLETNDFWRIRIGVRKEEGVRRKAGEFVLSHIGAEDRELLEKVFEKIGDGLHLPQKKR